MEWQSIVFGLLELAVIHGLNVVGLFLMFMMLPKRSFNVVIMLILGFMLWSLIEREIMKSQYLLWYDFRLAKWFGTAVIMGAAGFFIHEGKLGIGYGLAVMCLGGISNQLVIALNGFEMPVVIVLDDGYYIPLAREAASAWVHVRLWWLADWIPGYMTVISPGDILIDGGGLVMLVSYIKK